MSWRLGISTGACTHVPIVEMLSWLEPSGVAAVEVGTPPRHFDPWQDDQIAALASQLAARCLEAVSIHAPFGGLLDLADPNPHHRHAAIGAILTSASALKRLGGRIVVVHPSDLERNVHDVEARLNDCISSLQLLAGSCREASMTLLIETPLPHLIGGHPDEFAWILSRVDESVRVCLDTGHIALGRQWDRFIQVAGTRAAHVHAHDNRGRGDDHLPPGEGVIDWAHIASSLRNIQFTGWIMLELACPGADPAAYFKSSIARAHELLHEER
jgi:sugar phosphate isomerase/epimerase